MNILAVVGAGRKSGKTTTVEALVEELSSRGHRVGTIKQIHEEYFSIDKEGKDTWRHTRAGAEMVVSAAPREVCAIKSLRGKDRFKEAVHLLEGESLDYIVMEGDPRISLPRILVVRTTEEAKNFLETLDHVICISSLTEEGIDKDALEVPVFNPLDDVKEMADLVEKVFERIVPVAGG
ncbi:MAG: molybdopterin-guanine dinucleotide biosynthesis protein B [Candidatus Hydrothermarchaeales archaeon]